MSDRRRDRASQSRHHSASPHQALTAAAQLTSSVAIQRPLQYESWQDEVWAFYENLGEFNYGVEWFGEAMSRVRLNVAVVTPGGDEPKVIDSGPAVELIAKLNGGTDGHSALLRSLAVQLAVPGDAYLVGREVTEADIQAGTLLDAEEDENGRVWTIQPVNTLRRRRKFFGRNSASNWEMQVDEGVWVPLPAEALVCRIWDRHEHFPWRAMSPGRPALPIMREIDMYNRHIVATLVSRVALNGLMLIPEEVTLPVNPQYEEAADPFMAELIDVMMTAIKNPGSPAAAAPLPLRVPAELIEKFKHFTFATPLDQKIYENRQSALGRLATTLNLPAEIMTGMGDVNHWSGWQLSEDAIKIHISPKAEIITRCLTVGYLHPMLKAMGEDIRTEKGERLIVWYDTSELTQRPDRSEAARALHEMMIISDEAARRENGFDEADSPTDDELEKMVLRKLAINPTTAFPALKELTGLDIQPPAPPGMTPGAGGPPGASGPVGAPSEPPAPGLKGKPNDNQQPPPDNGSNTRRGQPDTGGIAPSPSRSAQTIAAKTHSMRRRARQSLSPVPARRR